VRRQGSCNLTLAGGNTPRDVYVRLGLGTIQSQIKWDRVHLYWGDERTVPPDHPDSNYGMVKATLLSRIAIPDENVHRIRGEMAPREAAAEYAALLQEHFDNKPPRFDLVLLGLGGDGHTASLFPTSRALEEQNRWVKAVFVPKFNTWRVTLTFPVLNNAREVIFLVAGSEKAKIVQRVLDCAQPTMEMPATLIRPHKGKLLWMLDAEAAALIDPKKITTE
ncbi:MAG: 6-phosphogluconolactonase, partial [bacterium]